jgi:DNA modification methylase
MPLAIMERIIRACSNKGDTVLDPFGGTFGTGCAAVALGRNFIGFDISKQYVEAGRKRIEEYSYDPENQQAIQARHKAAATTEAAGVRTTKKAVGGKTRKTSRL